jgi:hypothetical protein
MLEFRRQKGNDRAMFAWFSACALLVCVLGIVFIYFIERRGMPLAFDRAAADSATTSAPVAPVPQLDKGAYDAKMIAIANLGTSTSATTTATHATSSVQTKPRLWPAQTVYPNAGALLPFNRIVAYYGNFYSKQMGVLGQYPADVMLKKLQGEVAKWQTADPSTPVIPAIDYIAVTAQASAGADGKYRARMPDSQIDHAIDLANQIHGIVILDVQVGLSNLHSELPALEKYLKMPQVHLAIDPEFSMKTGAKPGTAIGSFSATDINYAAGYLAKLVSENNLPPKILIIHRFTEPMVTHYKDIKPLPEVQIVMDMDGWGSPIRKIGTYQAFIYPEPVQFAGFKLFYKNDLKPPSTRLLTPAELLKLKPQPIFIQYQ